MSKGLKSFFNTIFGRIICLAFGLTICLGSMWLTCRYVVLGKAIPHFAGDWYLDADAITFIATIIVGGVGVTVSQILGRVMYRVTGESIWNVLYWFATTISVLVTMLTFYTNEQYGSVNAKYSTETYQTLQEQKERYQNGLRHLNGELQTFMEGEYSDLRRRSFKTRAEQMLADRKKAISDLNRKLDITTERLLSYQDEGSKETVTTDSAKRGLAMDAINILGINPVFVDYLVICIRSFLLLAFAIIPDIIGPFLVAFAFTGSMKGRKKEERGNDFIKRMWFAATNQTLPTEGDDKEKDKLRNKSFSKLTSSELKLLLKDTKSVVDVIPTLKTRIFMEAAPDSGKTTLIQMLIKQAMARGEMTPDNSQLVIFDLQDEEKGKWPYWARIYGLNQNIESVKQGFADLKVLKDRGKQKKHVFVIVDEGMETAAMYEEKYKKPLGSEYSWIISFARQKGFGLLFSTVVGTGKAVGTEGMARIKGAYAYKINLLYHPITKIRCALVQVGGIEPDYYNVPDARTIEKITKPNLSTLVRTTASQALNGTVGVVRKVHEAGTKLTKTVPVEYETVPEAYQAFRPGTESGTTPVPPVPAEYKRENRQSESKIVPLRPTHSENRTTYNQDVPEWVKKSYQYVSEGQERLITELLAQGESDNKTIKEAFNTSPTPKLRKCLAAVKWMNGDEKERKAK